LIELLRAERCSSRSRLMDRIVDPPVGHVPVWAVEGLTQLSCQVWRPRKSAR
jgi:hypothetical protein